MSWKGCHNFNKSLGRKKGYLADCQNAVNCRRCRRCPQVPKAKLIIWAEETKQRKAQCISERQNLPSLLTTPFNVVKKED